LIAKLLSSVCVGTCVTSSAFEKEDKTVKAISEIPGVGLLTATAAIATMGDPKAFRSGREFAAGAGLVPKQTGSGGKVNLWHFKAR
jgi:transposase